MRTQGIVVFEGVRGCFVSSAARFTINIERPVFCNALFSRHRCFPKAQVEDTYVFKSAFMGWQDF
ncbi:hypothetical protein E2C01_013207 [Portunus trituberculatus]|uniref:Uncharacterized protein n=1 Tax=Portunus trituberculatus TaxID=210409 RepID=A0A5B7DFN4_PORTR|nr:hypothetical protein [Portunus trituberculatus]